MTLADDTLAGRAAVFGRDLLTIGPWKTRDQLKRAHQRGVLREGVHWDWLGGVRVYYVARILPGCTSTRAVISADDDRGTDYGTTTAKATAERLRRVLAHVTPGEAPARVARR